MSRSAKKAWRTRRRNQARKRVRLLWGILDRSQRDLYTESDTRTKFVMPLLHALGWDIYDINEVREGGYLDKTDVRKGLPDCVLYVRRKPHIVFEIKTVGERLAEGEDLEKLMGKAKNLNARYAVLTNFYSLKIYDPASGKRILDVEGRVDWEEKFDQLWALLSKPGWG